MDIAEDLIRIALLVAWLLSDRGRLHFQPLKSRGAPGRWRAAELEFEGSRKRFARVEAGGQRCFKYCFMATTGQPEGRLLEPSTLCVTAKRFAHPCGENSMKMEAREIGDVG